jgi:hypothetical protein
MRHQTPLVIDCTWKSLKKRSSCYLSHPLLSLSMVEKNECPSSPLAEPFDFMADSVTFMGERDEEERKWLLLRRPGLRKELEGL